MLVGVSESLGLYAQVPDLETERPVVTQTLSCAWIRSSAFGFRFAPCLPAISFCTLDLYYFCSFLSFHVIYIFFHIPVLDVY